MESNESPVVTEDPFCLKGVEERRRQYLRVLDYLKMEFDGYPYDSDKDPHYFHILFTDFGGINIEEELKQYHAWVLDQSTERKIFYRSRFRTWLKTAMRFKSGQKVFYHAQAHR